MPTITCTITLDPVVEQIDKAWIIDFLIAGENYTLEELNSANDETLLSYLQEEGLEEFIDEYGIDIYTTPIMISITPDEEASE